MEVLRTTTTTTEYMYDPKKSVTKKKKKIYVTQNKKAIWVFGQENSEEHTDISAYIQHW